MFDALSGSFNAAFDSKKHITGIYDLIYSLPVCKDRKGNKPSSSKVFTPYNTTTQIARRQGIDYTPRLTLPKGLEIKEVVNRLDLMSPLWPSMAQLTSLRHMVSCLGRLQSLIKSKTRLLQQSDETIHILRLELDKSQQQKTPPIQETNGDPHADSEILSEKLEKQQRVNRDLEDDIIQLRENISRMQEECDEKHIGVLSKTIVEKEEMQKEISVLHEKVEKMEESIGRSKQSVKTRSELCDELQFEDLVDWLAETIDTVTFKKVKTNCSELLKKRQIRIQSPETVQELFKSLRHLGVIDNSNKEYRDAVWVADNPRVNRIIQSIGKKIRADAAGVVEENVSDRIDLPSHCTVTRVETIGDESSQPGRSYSPCGLSTTNDKGELVVADSFNKRVQILDWTGHCRVCLSFNSFTKPFKPYDVAVSRDGKYYIIDKSNKQIVVCREDNTIITTFRLHRIFNPWSIALTKDGYVLVADCHRNCLSKYTVDGIYVADLGEIGEGACQFRFPRSVVVNSKNQIIVSDDNRIQVFDSQFRFLYSCGDSTDNQLSDPYGVDVDSQDNIYVCHVYNNRIAMYSHDCRFICNIDQDQVSSPIDIVVSKEYPMKIAITELGKDTVKMLYF
ncbi:uncharacterized protein LOC144356734 [Saccoglossus kowalevskii]